MNNLEEVVYKLKKDVFYSTKQFYVTNISSYVLDKNFKTTWSAEKQSAYLKSILIGLPTSKFEILVKDNSTIYLLSGKNRFFAIKQFLDNKIILNDDVYLTELNNILYSQLPNSLKREFLLNLENLQLTSFSSKTVPILKKIGNKKFSKVSFY